MRKNDNTIVEDTLPQGADRKTRIAIWVILLGLVNFMTFTVVYTLIGGEAVHGVVRRHDDGTIEYCLRGYKEKDVPVSRATFVYSAVHSISIWSTVAAVMLAMLTLAKDRVASAMHSTIVRGRTFITILATIIIIFVIFATILFIGRFLDKLSHPVRAAMAAAAGYA